MMFASQLALTIYLPAVVNIANDLDTSLERVQLIIPAYLGAFAVMQLVAGPLSDAFGRRPVILGGLALFTVASIACGLASNIKLLLVGRFFQAMGACTTIVVSRAIVRDGAEGKAAARALSSLAIALAVGPQLPPFSVASWSLGSIGGRPFTQPPSSASALLSPVIPTSPRRFRLRCAGRPTLPTCYAIMPFWPVTADSLARA